MALSKLLLMSGGLLGMAPVFRASAELRGNNNEAARPPGLSVGDLVVVFRVYGSDTSSSLTTAGGAAWGKAAAGSVGLGTGVDTFYKVLNATDVANGWTFSEHGPSLSLVFTSNGAQKLTLRDYVEANSASTSITSAGYTASGGGRSLISLVSDNTLTTPTAPGTSTLLATMEETVQLAAVAQNPLYRTGSVTWTGFSASTSLKKLWLFEVT